MYVVYRVDAYTKSSTINSTTTDGIKKCTHHKDNAQPIVRVWGRTHPPVPEYGVNQELTAAVVVVPRTLRACGTTPWHSFCPACPDFPFFYVFPFFMFPPFFLSFPFFMFYLFSFLSFLFPLSFRIDAFFSWLRCTMM